MQGNKDLILELPNLAWLRVTCFMCEMPATDVKGLIFHDLCNGSFYYQVSLCVCVCVCVFSLWPFDYVKKIKMTETTSLRYLQT